MGHRIGWIKSLFYTNSQEVERQIVQLCGEAAQMEQRIKLFYIVGFIAAGDNETKRLAKTNQKIQNLLIKLKKNHPERFEIINLAIRNAKCINYSS